MKKPRTPAPSSRPILERLKRKGPGSIREISRALSLTYEAVRQQVGELVQGGWVAPAPAAGPPRQCRPALRYVLTEAGEHLFPKRYDALTGELVATVMQECGSAALVKVLDRMVQARVSRWRDVLEPLPVKERLAALRGLYAENDAYMELQWRGDTPRLVERNCPFLNVAREHPALCSVSVNTLTRLLGVQVVREKRFQDGDGCCVFRVQLDRPVPRDAPFRLEPVR